MNHLLAFTAALATLGVVDAATLTSIPNLFIGTASSGNAFPGMLVQWPETLTNLLQGSAVPFAMAKVGTWFSYRCCESDSASC